MPLALQRTPLFISKVNTQQIENSLSCNRNLYKTLFQESVDKKTPTMSHNSEIKKILIFFPSSATESIINMH